MKKQEWRLDLTEEEMKKYVEENFDTIMVPAPHPEFLKKIIKIKDFENDNDR